MTRDGGIAAARASEPLRRRERHEVVVIATQAIEEENRKRHVRARRLDIECAPEPAHRFLEWVGRPARPERNGFAIEDQHAGRGALDCPNDLGDGAADIVAGARKYAHIVAVLVHLDAGAVELPFERCHRESGSAHFRCRRPVGRASARAAETTPRRNCATPRHPRRALSPQPLRFRRRSSLPCARNPPAGPRPPRRLRSSAPRALPAGARPAAAAPESPVRAQSLARANPTAGASVARAIPARRRGRSRQARYRLAPASASARLHCASGRASRISAYPIPLRPCGITPER